MRCRIVEDIPALAPSGHLRWRFFASWLRIPDAALGLSLVLSLSGVGGCFLLGLGDEDAFDRHINLVIPFEPSFDASMWENVGSGALVSTRELDIPLEVATWISLRDDEEAAPYLAAVVRVIPKSISFLVASNSLDVTLDPIEVYLGPASPSGSGAAGDVSNEAEPSLDSRFVLLLRTPTLSPGEETGEMLIEDFGPDEEMIGDLVSDLDFAMIARSGLHLPAGFQGMPKGGLGISALLNIVLVARPEVSGNP